MDAHCSSLPRPPRLPPSGFSPGPAPRRHSLRGRVPPPPGPVLEDNFVFDMHVPRQCRCPCEHNVPYDAIVMYPEESTSSGSGVESPPSPLLPRLLPPPRRCPPPPNPAQDTSTWRASSSGGTCTRHGPHITLASSSPDSKSPDSSRTLVVYPTTIPPVDLTPRHWLAVLLVLILAAAAGLGVPLAMKLQAGASLEERLEAARRLLSEVPLIDGHNDLPWNIRKFLHNHLAEFRFSEDLRKIMPWKHSPWSHTDLPRIRDGLVGAQFWAAYVPCEAQFRDAVQLTLEQIDVIRRLTEKYEPALTLCASAADIRAAHQANRLCSLIGVEGGHALGNSLAVLRSLYDLGVRYLTLTSTCNTPWADCSRSDLPDPETSPEHGGLSKFGKSVVREMNRLGMIVDLSHVSVKTMRAALATSQAPVIFSHSSARALCNKARNVPDDILKQVALNRGLVMVNFYSQFLTCRNDSSVEDAVAHINHIRAVAGVDYVGLGAGYDGINFTPRGLEDVSRYPALFAELIRTGQWNAEELKKLAGLNFLRVLEEVEKVRDQLKQAGVSPLEETIPPRYIEGRGNCSSADLLWPPSPSTSSAARGAAGTIPPPSHKTKPPATKS